MNYYRRKIVKSLGIVTGAAAVGFFPVSSILNLPLDNKENVKTKATHATQALLIGAGSRGQRFARFAKRHPDILKIACISEPLQDRRHKVANVLGVDASHCFTHWKEVCEMRPEADVAIITASGNYIDICSNALRSGYHVWVDRPSSINPDEIIAINELARHCNRELLFCYIHEDQINFMNHSTFEKKPEATS